jgi:hypothetical protein
MGHTGLDPNWQSAKLWRGDVEGALMPDIRRSTASRRRNTAWNRFWLFAGVAALAITAWYMGGGTPATVWLPCLVFVAGGVLTGVLASRDTARVRMRSALLAPIPILAFAGLVMAANAESNADLLLVGLILVIPLLLFDIPLALAFRYRSGRSSGMLIGLAGDPGASALDRELDLATDHGRATTVVREYLADAEGRAHLEADAKALDARGYDSGSVDHVGSDLAGAGVAVVELLTNSFAASQQAKIVATFRLRSAQGEGLPIAEPSPMVRAFDSARIGCLSVALIVTWTIAGVTIMVVGFLVLAVLFPSLTNGNPLANIPPLLGLVVAFVGSIGSIRWLRARG